MREYEVKRVDSLIYSCAKAMIVAGDILFDVGNIEYNGKKYRATLEVKELVSQNTKKAFKAEKVQNNEKD